MLVREARSAADPESEVGQSREKVVTTRQRGAYVYMVVCNDGTLYTGWATDVKARVRAHNAGRGSRYCRQRRPVCLVYQEELPSRSAARKREQAIKRLPRRRKLQLIGPEPHRHREGTA